jgi:hypothetical protein
VTVLGFVQEELLRHDLEAMGILGPEQERMRIFVMIAEKDIDKPDEFFWWSSNKEAVSSQYQVQQTLEKKLIEKGVIIVNPLEASASILSEKIGQSSEPDIETVCQFGSQLNSRIVVIGKSLLKTVQEQKLSSLPNIQCDLNTRVIDVKHKSVIVQAATYALGIHINEASAAKDAIEKACTQMAEQIIDKIYYKIKNTHEYLFKLTFDKPVSETEVQAWLAALKNSFPEIEPIEIRSTEEKNRWSVKLNSPLESAVILQKMFETEIAGYTTEVKSINEEVIELKVSPIVL